VSPDIGDAFADAELVRSIFLSESRHFPMLDERPKFNRLLRDFLIAESLESLSLKEEWRRQTR